MIPTLKRLFRTAKFLIRSPRIPRPVKALVAVAFLPIPGPFDEFVGLIALGIVAVFYRAVLVEAWAASA